MRAVLVFQGEGVCQGWKYSWGKLINSITGAWTVFENLFKRGAILEAADETG
jgi:hypothetical protein